MNVVDDSCQRHGIFNQLDMITPLDETAAFGAKPAKPFGKSPEQPVDIRGKVCFGRLPC